MPVDHERIASAAGPAILSSTSTPVTLGIRTMDSMTLPGVACDRDILVVADSRFICAWPICAEKGPRTVAARFML